MIYFSQKSGQVGSNISSKISGKTHAFLLLFEPAIIRNIVVRSRNEARRSVVVRSKQRLLLLPLLQRSVQQSAAVGSPLHDGETCIKRQHGQGPPVELPSAALECPRRTISTLHEVQILEIFYSSNIPRTIFISFYLNHL